jgi:hypothetical protein
MDGGYAIGGGPLLLKTDPNGQEEWEIMLEGELVNESYLGDMVRSIIQTTDGGFVIAGNIGFWGSKDMWLVKFSVSEITTQPGPGFEYSILILSITLFLIAQKWKRRG